MLSGGLDSRGVRARAGTLTFLRAETSAGLLLVAATVVAVIWANTAPGAYEDVWDARLAFGPPWLHLSDMTLSGWVTDGLLALFFFLAGIELKRELVVGELADRRAAALPIAAAIGGMIAPALIYLVVSRGAEGGGRAWAVPVATDIAFALGVLSLAGNRVPIYLRIALLGLAITDDLGGILLIAVVFATHLVLWWLAAATALLALFAFAQRRGWDSPLVIAGLGIPVWVCVHASGVHATIAGVAMGFLVRSRPKPGEARTPAEHLEMHLLPFSVGFVVPVFALSTTGVSVAPSALADMVTEPVAQGVILGLLVGKFVGVLAGAWLAVRLKIARLPAGIRWADFLPIGLLAGIGYTVSLLIAHLALPSKELTERVSTAVLTASVIASILALVALRLRFAAPREREPATTICPDPAPPRSPPPVSESRQSKPSHVALRTVPVGEGR